MRTSASTVVGLLAALLAGALLPEANAASIIAHWRFEEGSGDVALNSAGDSALNGTITNAVYTTDSAFGDYALDFNGSNSWVEVLNNALLIPETIGISLWFKGRTSQGRSADIFDKGHGAGSSPYYGGYVFQYYYDESTIDVAYGNNSQFVGINTGDDSVMDTGHHVVAGGSTLDGKDNQWHHLVANLGASEVSLYVDGQLAHRYEQASFGPLVQNDSNLFFGRHGSHLGRYFNGLIDEIQLYDGALTQAEVTNLFVANTTVPVHACAGFEAPMADYPVEVRGSRALPLKAEIVNGSGSEVTGLDLTAPPVIQVRYEYGTPEAEDVSDGVLPVGQGTEGNQFSYTDEDKWQFNLKTKNYSAPGTYTVFMESGDASEYRLSPSCTTQFVVR